MAADNVTLGRFQLAGIPPAPRGVPQIEVSFDIDANGIVNVSAKDLGTGKEQTITLTASSGLSEEDIEKMVKDAEAHAEEDKKRREEAEARNEGSALVYSVDKTLTELGDKVSPEQKTRVEAARDELQAALDGDDIEAIKTKTQALNEVLHEVSTQVYQQAQQASDAASGNGQADENQSDDNVVDADFTVTEETEGESSSKKE